MLARNEKLLFKNVECPASDLHVPPHVAERGCVDLADPALVDAELAANLLQCPFTFVIETDNLLVTGWQDGDGVVQLLVDHARGRHALKRGIAVTLNEEIFQRAAGADQTEEILAVDEILARLAALDPQQARVVELRYFGGLSVEETAEALAISPRTVKRDWAMAKAWMKTQLDTGASR